MKIFSLDKHYQIVCEWKNTRNGFRHEATILYNGIQQDKTKVCYLNRTWERFEYESVIFKIIDKYFKDKEAKKYKKVIIKKFN